MQPLDELAEQLAASTEDKYVHLNVVACVKQNVRKMTNHI